MTLAEQLGAFVAGIRCEEVPEASLRALKRLVLDTLGCALGAVGCEPARIAEEVVREQYPGGEGATILGSAAPTSLEAAAFVNGVLARYLDFMDVAWDKDVCHPSENIPLALAAAEAQGAPGTHLIEAVLAGYETQLRLASAFSLTRLQLHHVSAAGFAAPLTLGKLWRLPPARLAHAVALGGARHLTLGVISKGRLSMAKALGFPATAMECVLSTRLAAKGFTGPLEVLEWLYQKVPSQAGPTQPFLDTTRERYWIDGVSIKRYPAQFALQGPVEAAIQLHDALKGEKTAIDRVGIEIRTEEMERTADPAKFKPANRETADHSLPCCVAMALLDGRLDPDQFEHGRWQATDVLALAAHTQVTASADYDRRFPEGRPAAVTVHLRGGGSRRVEVLVPLGDATRPLGDQALEAKFHTLAEPVIGTDKAGAAIAAIASLETLGDVRELTRLLRPA
ncbi:MAG: MmgE/PrpD family protein [Candidatus Lambdaproteobacteria bacterium]|nr:MmgE/PrpD family protein [Candidatus Lambdaproteobacteria bacterium]